MNHQPEIDAALQRMDDEAAWQRGLDAHPKPYVGIRDPTLTELAELSAHIRLAMERLAPHDSEEPK